MIRSNRELKLDDWRELVLADNPQPEGDEAGMEKRMWEHTVRLGEHAAKIYRLDLPEKK